MNVLRVAQPGLLTTVQDLGRPNAITAGVPPGGAMDRFAIRAANLLVGNLDGDAALECTGSGPHLVAEHACLAAVTGADLDPHVNSRPAPMWTAFLLGEGAQLTFAGRRAGARSYVAIAGGIEADRWFGSASTYLLVARGGMHGRPLKAGDVIATGREPARSLVSGRTLGRSLRPDYSDHTLHAIAGPHLKRLDADSRAALFGPGFRVGREADRMGYRLDGPALTTTGDELLSYGLVMGAVQVPRGGTPILLMADHQTAGGYPVPAVIASASVPIAAQLLPGDELRLVPTTIDRALQMRRALLDALKTIRT
jgi:antagonist of KipI